MNFSGDNFCGEVMRVDLKACINGMESKSYHWMVKLPTSDPGRAAVTKAMMMEEKEFGVYRDLIPAFRCARVSVYEARSF